MPLSERRPTAWCFHYHVFKVDCCCTSCKDVFHVGHFSIMQIWTIIRPGYEQWNATKWKVINLTKGNYICTQAIIYMTLKFKIKPIFESCILLLLSLFIFWYKNVFFEWSGPHCRGDKNKIHKKFIRWKWFVTTNYHFEVYMITLNLMRWHW